MLLIFIKKIANLKRVVLIVRATDGRKKRLRDTNYHFGMMTLQKGQD